MPVVHVGVDGCKGGWVAAIGNLAACQIEVFATIGDLIADIGPDALIAIDMPIGLPDRVGLAGRAPERLVRPLLGARQSSVFSVPARAAVEAPDYLEACQQALAHSDPPRKVSKQCFHLFPKIRELDAFLRSHPAWTPRIFEAHPEVAFWRLNGERALDQPKKVKGAVYGPGMALRQSLLEAAGVGAAYTRAPTPKGAALDDVLDALATLTVAVRIADGVARSFPSPPVHDGFGLQMAIWT
jgi:predicted RNase H-like nuclease